MFLKTAMDFFDVSKWDILNLLDDFIEQLLKYDTYVSLDTVQKYMSYWFLKYWDILISYYNIPMYGDFPIKEIYKEYTQALQNTVCIIIMGIIRTGNKIPADEILCCVLPSDTECTSCGLRYSEMG